MKIQEGFMPFGEFKTYYRVVGEKTGNKKPLLLLHGGPGSTHNYFEVLDRLAEEDGRQIVMYDQIGCGESFIEGHPELFTPESWAKELIEMRKHLGLDEVHILGQSWGGMLLLDHVCNYDHDGVKSVILSSTLPASWMWGEEQHRLIKYLPEDYQEAIAKATSTGDYSDPLYQAAEAEYMRRHAAGAVTEDSPECLRRPVKKGGEAYVVGWGQNEFTPTGTLKDFDVTAQLKDIKEPTLVIDGGDDLCTPYIAKYMYDRIPGAEWELFRTCRHMCFVEDNDRYVELMKEWLNKHD
ncbi:proline iminopeptidase [Lachnospiraceae bacterium PF1-21]|uniref:Proline iminopeptidase n=1 Tax=Ohessyouella blattaphilus TaxID=2949333 RepID=A0ABT1EDT9_9FIRM|nr:proline iminopeptidase-family hydrolase [Ohessyouella blattaphilus]MCP1108870.1 proline iminopeptidase-family hydrolase [Ohessyouella blattaphilus]MCR8562264.1 proline iminopeptidase-family hydrolase [Ohessyouella blattaphilus]